jgi:aminoglycoside 2''-phosphotransferase
MRNNKKKDMALINMRFVTDIEQAKSFLQKNVPELAIQTINAKQGDEHSVMVVNDTWIFRFAKSHDVQEHMSIEVKLLKMLENKITCAIPKVTYYFPQAFCFGYQKIPGVLLSAAMYAQLTATEKQNLADAFAQFLHELHSHVSVDAGKQIGLMPADWPLAPEALQAKLAALTDKFLQELFDQFIIEYQRIVSTEQKLEVVHNDLHSDNILIDPVTKKLSGIIDFTSAAIDTAYHDFRYLHLIDMELVTLAVQAYNQKSGENLTVRNAYLYCMATEFSRLSEALENEDLPKAAEIKDRILLIFHSKYFNTKDHPHD